MILDVPYQSQKPYEIDKPGQRKWCGIACLWMIMAFYLKDAAPTIDELLEKYGGEFENNGFQHKDLLKIAREYHLQGFRKSWWAAPGVDDLITKFKSEGESEDEVTQWLQTNIDESFYTLEKLINQNTPVILSVSKEFSPSEDTHLVVLTGVEDEDLIIHDPFEKGENFRITRQEFKKFWLRQAIVLLLDH